VPFEIGIFGAKPHRTSLFFAVLAITWQIGKFVLAERLLVLLSRSHSPCPYLHQLKLMHLSALNPETADKYLSVA